MKQLVKQIKLSRNILSVIAKFIKKKYKKIEVIIYQLTCLQLNHRICNQLGIRLNVMKMVVLFADAAVVLMNATPSKLPNV